MTPDQQAAIERLRIDTYGLTLATICAVASLQCAVFVHWGHWCNVALSAALMTIYCIPRQER